MELDRSRIMVTGGTGFIGSHLVDRLVKKGARVIVYDNFNEYYTGKENNIKRHIGNPNFTLIKADILDHHTLYESMTKVDVVFHLAAQAGVRYSYKNPLEVNTVNTNGTLNVLNAARERKVKKIIFASSSSVYGTPQYVPIDENHPTNPLSIYGASKLAAEKYCQIYNGFPSLTTVILRYHTVYGPRQRPDMAIHKWTRLLFDDKPPVIYGDGKQTRDFTYVNDIIDGTLKAAELEEANGEIFNLGYGARTSINEIIELLLKLTEKEHIKPIYQKSMIGDVHDTYANIRKANKHLDFNPRVPLKQGLRCFIKWFAETKRNKSI